eukprot:4653005-Pleurochrysis_carterae.AAC.2
MWSLRGTHLAAFVYMVRCSVVNKDDGSPWATLDEINAAIKNYTWPTDRNDRPYGFHHSVTKGTEEF